MQIKMQCAEDVFLLGKVPKINFGELWTESLERLGQMELRFYQSLFEHLRRFDFGHAA